MIPIGKPSKYRSICNKCLDNLPCTYVKTRLGFMKVCLQCAYLMRKNGELVMPDKINAR